MTNALLILSAVWSNQTFSITVSNKGFGYKYKMQKVHMTATATNYFGVDNAEPVVEGPLTLSETVSTNRPNEIYRVAEFQPPWAFLFER